MNEEKVLDEAVELWFPPKTPISYTRDEIKEVIKYLLEYQDAIENSIYQTWRWSFKYKKHSEWWTDEYFPKWRVKVI